MLSLTEWTHAYAGAVSEVTMWFSFLSASAISAYISALAGAFAVAVSAWASVVLLVFRQMPIFVLSKSRQRPVTNL